MTESSVSFEPLAVPTRRMTDANRTLRDRLQPVHQAGDIGDQVFGSGCHFLLRCSGRKARKRAASGGGIFSQMKADPVSLLMEIGAAM